MRRKELLEQSKGQVVVVEPEQGRSGLPPVVQGYDEGEVRLGQVDVPSQPLRNACVRNQDPVHSPPPNPRPHWWNQESVKRQVLDPYDWGR